MTDERILIVGASLAGSSAAHALRRSGFKGELVLLGDEPHRPYNRPPLSKEFLFGDCPDEKLYIRAGDYYDKQGINLRLGERAVRLDAGARMVELQSGERL